MASSEADLDGGVAAFVDVHGLAGVCVRDDDLRVVRMVLNHPFPALLALCPCWLASSWRGRCALASGRAWCVCQAPYKSLMHASCQCEARIRNGSVTGHSEVCIGQGSSPAAEGTTPVLSARFLLFMSSVTLRSPLVTPSPWSHPTQCTSLVVGKGRILGSSMACRTCAEPNTLP